MKQPSVALADEYIAKEDLAKLLRKHPRTLDNWHVRRYGPPRINIGGKHLYRTMAVRAWLDSLERGGGHGQE